MVFGGLDFFLTQLSDSVDIDNLAQGEPLFIPAKARVQVRLRWEFPETELLTNSSVTILNESVFGFVLYDDSDRYEIDFPKPAIVHGKYTDADTVQTKEDAKTIDPEKMKPWEFYATCSQASTILAACKSARMKSDYEAGSYTILLPILVPPLPKGSTIVPDQSVCDNATQWQDYCTRKR